MVSLMCFSTRTAVLTPRQGILHSDRCQLPFWSAVLPILLPTDLLRQVQEQDQDATDQGIRLRWHIPVCWRLHPVPSWIVLRKCSHHESLDMR